MDRKRDMVVSDRTSNWGLQQRLEFIEFRLFWEGRLNRSDLIEFFGISRPQASIDLARYIEMAPGNIIYDRKQKTYLAARTFRPALGHAETSDAYLELLLARERPKANFLGWAPTAEVVKYPRRRVETEVLRQVLSAIRKHLMLQVEYQSMNRPNPTSRAISPHAIAFDGFRWHTRAYCHDNKAFRDFVFARILKVHKSSATSIDPRKDDAWHHVLKLVLAPHPKLTTAQKRAVALDYGMNKERKVVHTRQALAFYLLRQLGLDHNGHAAEAKAQHVVLVNRDEVARVINAQDQS